MEISTTETTIFEWFNGLRHVEQVCKTPSHLPRQEIISNDHFLLTFFPPKGFFPLNLTHPNKSISSLYPVLDRAFVLQSKTFLAGNCFDNSGFLFDTIWLAKLVTWSLIELDGIYDKHICSTVPQSKQVRNVHNFTTFCSMTVTCTTSTQCFTLCVSFHMCFLMPFALFSISQLMFTPQSVICSLFIYHLFSR